MIKTEFMELLEELDSINEACAREEMTEAIEDIDFNALTSAEEEAERLNREARRANLAATNKKYFINDPIYFITSLVLQLSK